MKNWQSLNSRCYVPYSQQPESCIVEAVSGTGYLGVRIENISFPLTISATRAALSSCLANDDTPTAIHLSGAQQPDPYWVESFSLEVHTEATIPDIPYYDPLIAAENADPAMILEEFLHKAVTPASNFAVAALLETTKGFVGGANVEFSSWSRGLCAERVAISRAIAHGYQPFHRLFITTSGGDFSSPCGSCRQVIMEHLPNNKLVLRHPDGTQSTHKASHLLPFNFRSEQLRKPEV